MLKDKLEICVSIFVVLGLIMGLVCMIFFINIIYKEISEMNKCETNYDDECDVYECLAKNEYTRSTLNELKYQTCLLEKQYKEVKQNDGNN